MDLLQIDEFALRSLGTRVSGDFVKKVEFVQRTQQKTTRTSFREMILTHLSTCWKVISPMVE